MSQIPIQSHQDAVDGSILLGGSRSSVYLENSIDRIYITKIWNVWDHCYWFNFYTELYLYAHPKFLRPLQGICVPNIIGIYGAPGGRVSFAMDLPHSVGWRTASPTISAEEKETIIEAYTKIHAQGIEHGCIAYRHILIGDDSKVTIIDFSKSKCILGSNREEGTELVATMPECLAREMRKVKFLLDYSTAKKEEYARTNGGPSTNDILPRGDNSPFTFLELEEWETEGDRDIRFEVRPNAEGLKIEPLSPRRYQPQTLKSNASPCASATMHNMTSAKDVERHSSKNNNRKHSRDTSEDDHPTAKRVKVVQFHPDTNDNGLWATGRPLRKIHRQPTPFIHEMIERPPLDSGGPAVDIVDWGDAGRPGSSPALAATSSPPWAHAMEFSPTSIVLTAENGVPETWQVSEDVFHEVATYIKLRTPKRLPTDVPESAVSKGEGDENGKGILDWLSD